MQAQLATEMEPPMRGGEADLRRLLLISNSTQYRRGFLDHVETEIRNLLASNQRILFVPFALFDRDAAAAAIVYERALAEGTGDLMDFAACAVLRVRSPRRRWSAADQAEGK
jgi:hypothetical protein